MDIKVPGPRLEQLVAITLCERSTVFGAGAVLLHGEACLLFTRGPHFVLLSAPFIFKDFLAVTLKQFYPKRLQQSLACSF